MKRKIMTFLPYILYGMLGVILIVYKIGHYPQFWYDEGGRLIMSRTLAETGRYATYSVDGFMPFNVWVTTGPLDVLSVAAGIALFGKHVAVVRLAIFPFCLLDMFMILKFGQLLFGKQAGWLGALLVLAVPPNLPNSFILMSRQFMSENISTAMVILALFLWIRSWQTGRISYSWVGGVLMGLGILSKTQVAIWLFPALGIVWLMRLIQDRKRSWREIVFLISAMSVITVWNLYGNFQMSVDMRESNRQVLQELIHLQLLNVEPRQISTTTLVISGFMFLVSCVVLSGLLHNSKGQLIFNTIQWGQAMLAVSSLFCGLWFFFLSIRFPRYSFTGWIFTLMLVGWIVWRLQERVSGWDLLNNLKIERWLYPVTIGVLVTFCLVGNGLPLLRIQGPIAAEKTSNFIDKNIPQEAVIETTEAELFGLTDHWEFHFPPYSAIMTAIRQIFYEEIQPQVSYDFLEYDPDYLITGQFSDWIHLYWNSEIVESDFIKLVEFSPYQVYKRKR